jgi:hypothetical protein
MYGRRSGALGALSLTPILAAAEPASGGSPHWSVNIGVVIATLVTVCLCVLLHYDVLNLLSRWLVRLKSSHRRRVVFAIFGLLGVHTTEIWVFGLAYDLLLQWPIFGSMHGIDGGLLDFVYLSAMTFSTVGTSDTYLTGPIRFLAGTEALTGLMLITWSASFTFLEMQRFWRDR